MMSSLGDERTDLESSDQESLFARCKESEAEDEESKTEEV